MILVLEGNPEEIVRMRGKRFYFISEWSTELKVLFDNGNILPIIFINMT